jgi:hypothetical protein
VVLAALPQPSVTVRVTVQVPAAGKVWETAEAVLVGVPLRRLALGMWSPG